MRKREKQQAPGPGTAASRPASGQHDPITKLTPAERKFVDWLDSHSTREGVLAKLKDHLQTAIEIELATIPIYLYTYYSLVRTKETGEHISPTQVYANKAGAVIMSVAVEEMLHMSLGANILYALGVEPQLYGRAPGQYPTGLPFHNPVGASGPDGQTAVLIPLAGFSFEQLWHFLQIEYPEKWNIEPLDRNWDTIGQFYSYIRCLLGTKFLCDADFRQGPAARGIQPYNYSPNSTDTLYPAGKFDPWKPPPPALAPEWARADPYPSAAKAAVYTDRGDSHAGLSELLTVSTLQDAAEAIDTICDQGEGCPTPGIGPGEDDDPSKGEHSHYVKFLRLQAQLEAYADTSEKPASQPPAPERPIEPVVREADLAAYVTPFPTNPTVAGYPEELRPIAAFCSGCFQYMLIMTETIYRVPPKNQKLFFNEGLHRSMIWVLDSYILHISRIPVGDGNFMGPTFENWDLGPRQASFAGLKALGLAAIAAAAAIVESDPDGAAAAAMPKVVGTIEFALGLGDGPRQPLPDVAQYWPDANE